MVMTLGVVYDWVYHISCCFEKGLKTTYGHSAIVFKRAVLSLTWSQRDLSGDHGILSYQLNSGTLSNPSIWLRIPSLNQTWQREIPYKSRSYWKIHQEFLLLPCLVTGGYPCDDITATPNFGSDLRISNSSCFYQHP